MYLIDFVCTYMYTFVSINHNYLITTVCVEMRDQSGMIVLQEHIKKHAGKLSFLKEVSPVSWLKFEEVLLNERERARKRLL